MKKLLLLIVFGFWGSFFADSLNAQTDNYFGLKAGISIPNLSKGSQPSNVWSDGFSSRIAPNLGAIAEFGITRKFSVQVEFDYIGEGGKRNGIQPITVPDQYLSAFQQGLHTDRDYVFADMDNVSRINYVQIPVMAKLNIPVTHNQRLKVFGEAGPFVSLLVSAKQLVHSDNLKVYLDNDPSTELPQVVVDQFFGSSIDTVIQARPDLHKVNVGIQGAVGFSYNFPSGKVFIQGGGNYGLINTQKDDEHGKNRIGAATMAIGYALIIGRKKHSDSEK